MTGGAFLKAAILILLLATVAGCGGERSISLPGRFIIYKTDADTGMISTESEIKHNKVYVPPRIIRFCVVDEKYVFGELKMMEKFKDEFGEAEWFMLDATTGLVELWKSRMELEQFVNRRSLKLPRGWKVLVR